MKRSGILIFALATCAAQTPLTTEILAAHNAVRTHLKIPSLTWSDKLAAQAQDWADTLLARHQFAHRRPNSYGENLFAITGALASPAQVIADWAAESRDYDYTSNKCGKVCGHYTQIIWATTKEVGCGVARNSQREVWVCDYSPPGNWIGHRPY
ncbi:MAG: CAP domain-containing protein [Bryobacteraceae bacterium]